MFESLSPLRVPGVERLPEGESRKVRYQRAGNTEEIVLCRVDGRLYALDTLCPHEGGRLSEGPLARGRHAVCPLHLYRFDAVDGACVGIECDSAKTYRVEEQAGCALVWIESPAQADA
jgi:nitrite reductase/ring-hydroxylating ferredoxin subunit